jgi:hypothetical protein
LLEELCKIKDSIKAQKIETKKGVPLLLAILVLCVTFALGIISQ